MGVTREWIDKLLKLIPDAEVGAIPAPSVVIEDISLNIYKIFAAKSSLEAVYEGIQNRMSFYSAAGSLEKYVATFDDRRYVPLSKVPTQKKREHDDSHILPLTDVEIRMFGDFTTGIIADDPVQFVKRMRKTPGVAEQMWSNVAHAIGSSVTPDASIDVLLDGAYSNRIFADETLPEERRTYAFTGAGINGYGTVAPNARHSFAIKTRKRPRETAVAMMFDHLTRVPTGEGDIKVACHFVQSALSGELHRDKKKEHVVLVRVHDGDLPWILLLRMRRLINKSTMKLPSHLYIDIAATGPSRYVDLVKLWRGLHDHFYKRFPHVKNPIETIVMLVLMTKTDYTYGFHGLGHGIIWTEFLGFGHSLLNLPTPVFPNEARPAIVIDGMVPREGDAMSIEASLLGIGDDDRRVAIEIAEHKVAEFVARLFFRKAYPKHDLPRKAVDRQALRAHINDRYGKEDGKHVYLRMDDDEAIMAEVRRIAWTLDYWANAGTSCDYLNPLEVVMVPDPRGYDPKNPRVPLPPVPVSLYGWIEEPEESPQKESSEKTEESPKPPPKRTTRIVPAKRVYVTRPDPLARV
jgi:hypothetical protein